MKSNHFYYLLLICLASSFLMNFHPILPNLIKQMQEAAVTSACPEVPTKITKNGGQQKWADDT